MKTDCKPVTLTEIEGKIDIGDICTISCPFLGTETDDTTAMAFAHPSNRCYRHGTANSRQLHFQRTFCLSEAYEKCLIYGESNENHDEVVANRKNAAVSRSRLLLGSAIIILILLLMLLSWPFMDQFVARNATYNLPIDLNRLQTVIDEMPEDSAGWVVIRMKDLGGEQERDHAIGKSASKPIYAAKTASRDIPQLVSAG